MIESVSIAPVAEPRGVEKATTDAEMMKDIRKARLQRKVLQDPSLAGKLVATEASPVYNARGEVVQALTTTGMDV